MRPTTRGLTALALTAAMVAAPVTGATAAAAKDGSGSGERPGNGQGARGELRDALDALTAAGVPGAIVEVRDEQGVWRAASGVASLRHERPRHPNERFRVGSVTKSLVATTVLQLADEGKVALDDEVGDYLPGVVPGDQGITVRQLLNHTSGLYNYTRDLLAGQDLPAVLDKVRQLRFRTLRPRELVRMAMEHEPQFQPDPETGVWYSNTNYILLGMLIEEITGHEPRAEVRKRIIRPLDLHATSFPEWNPFIFGPNPRGYEDGPESDPFDVTVYSPSWARSAGAVISTTSDLNRFYRALLTGELLSAGMLDEMQTTVFLPEGPQRGGLTYGLGLFAVQGCSGTLWGHSGGLPGFTTYSISSADGARQLTLSINEGVTAGNDPAVAAALNELLLAEFCGGTATTERSTQPAQSEFLPVRVPDFSGLLPPGDR